MSKSQTTTWLALIGVVLLALVGLFAMSWWNDSGSDATIAPEQSGAEGALVMDGELPAVEGQEQGETDLTPAPEDGARVDLVEEERAAAEAEEQAELQWVTGKVVLSYELPKDEIVHVLSLTESKGMGALYGTANVAGGAWDPEDMHSDLHATVLMEEDGSFRISVPAGQSVAHLAVSGRYLFSRTSTAVPMSEGEEGQAILSAEMGAWITGKLIAPKSSADVSMEEVIVSLGPDITASFDAMTISANAYGNNRESGENGEYEFRAAPVVLTQGIVVKHEELAARLLLGIDLDPGEHHVLDIRMQEGATLRGVVKGPDGEPLADSDIEVNLLGQLGAGVDELREGKSDENGAFVLEHVFTGRPLQLTAESEGLRGARLRIPEKLRDGQVVEGLVIEVEAGKRLWGRVLYPDGTPAAGVEVEIEPDLSKTPPQMMGARIAFSEEAQVETGEDGSFEATGLDDGPFMVTATIESEEGSHPGSWRRREMGVVPGIGAMQIDLEGLVSLSGMLTTASDLEIGAFSVSMVLEGSGGMMGVGAERLSESFDEPEEGGLFTKDGVHPGLWEVTVKAEGFAFSSTIDIEVPQPEEMDLPVFDLVPSSSVSGVVVDTFNNPMPGARVSLELGLNERISGIYSGETPGVVTDHEGKFLLSGLNPGGTSIVASMTGFASSEPKNVALVSGQATEGIELALRVGGILTGEVMQDDGEPAVGRMVVVQVMPSYTSQHILTSGPDGEFRVENLEPGQWQVVSIRNAMTGELDVEGGDDLGDMLGDMKMDTVNIEEGKSVHLILGKPPENPIEVFGTVVHDGEPMGGSLVSFIPEGAESLGDMKIVTTGDEDGSFRVTLDKRGPYLVSIQSNYDTGRENRVEMREFIPEEAPNHNMTLELPVGKISGKVIGVDGKPSARCRISLSVDEGIVFGTLMGGHYTEISTEEDGTYEIPFLAPGKYAIAAGGATLGGLLGDDSVAGRELQSGIMVGEGETVSGVDFRLKRPGVIHGLVLGADQQPVPDASVFLRDANGRVLDRISFITTDGAGKFTYGGVAEGEYRFSAKKGESVSPLSDLIKIKAGGEASGQVVLEEGTTLVVTVIDKAGDEVDATLSVKDQDGHEMAGLRSLNEMMAMFSGTYSTMEQPVGPLPLGKYRVVATLKDGRAAYKNITVSGRATRKVKLRVK